MRQHPSETINFRVADRVAGDAPRDDDVEGSLRCQRSDDESHVRTRRCGGTFSSRRLRRESASASEAQRTRTEIEGGPLWADPDKRVGPARPVAVAHITAIRPAVDVITPTRALQSSRAAGYVYRLLAKTVFCRLPDSSSAVLCANVKTSEFLRRRLRCNPCFGALQVLRFADRYRDESRDPGPVHCGPATRA
jgi:hypothetical protein